MQIIFRSFVFLFLSILFYSFSSFAKSSFAIDINKKTILVPPNQPAVNRNQYYCKNDAVTLTATPSPGGVLNWYGTNAVGGTRTATPPAVDTSVSGSKLYYVSQTVAGEESTRAFIEINVDKQIGLFCDGSKATSTSVNFDFANVGQTSYAFSYTVTGVLGTVSGIWTGASNYTVPGLSAGQSVDFNLTAVGAPICVSVKDMSTCKVPCGASVITPNFNISTTYCINEVTTDLPNFSNDSPPIEGTWSSLKVDTSIKGSPKYTFTPDSKKFPCALTKTLPVTVSPAEPDFTDLSVCSGAAPPMLESESPNKIKGSWTPSIIDNTTSAAYVFTPTPGQPCSPTDKSIYVTILPSNTIASSDYTVTAAFNDNQIISFTDPLGPNFVYQLDSGPYQFSPVFENVSTGIHAITVNDIYGCSPFTRSNVLVINYPKFFTPNGDGFNDTWKISDLNNLIFKIYIFDRYGKLLKEISPDGLGWDGTYLGQQVPADDYWFTVDYVENLIPKKLRSHFSLKR